MIQSNGTTDSSDPSCTDLTYVNLDNERPGNLYGNGVIRIPS